MLNKLTKQFRIRKFLRKRYNISDNELDVYMIMKHHLNHIPSREELFNLEYVYRTFLI